MRWMWLWLVLPLVGGGVVHASETEAWLEARARILAIEMDRGPTAELTPYVNWKTPRLWKRAVRAAGRIGDVSAQLLPRAAEDARAEGRIPLQRHLSRRTPAALVCGVAVGRQHDGRRRHALGLGRRGAPLPESHFRAGPRGNGGARAGLDRAAGRGGRSAAAPPSQGARRAGRGPQCLGACGTGRTSGALCPLPR